MRRMCEGALKCALRDFRREELTLRWAGQEAASEESVGTESFGQARGTAAYCQLCLSCCTLPRHQPAGRGGKGEPHLVEYFMPRDSGRPLLREGQGDV